MGLETIMETVNSELFGVWFLIGAVLVFFMQCGFAMVETGFTRAKNAGNIIMKNLMDFCIGTVMFILLGYGLMCGQDYIAGVIGLPNLGIFTHYNDFNWSNFVFNLVFCATAATIVSGAMAERTKFSAYCIYSAVISAVVYPIEAGWVWNVDGNGWLQKLGFHDYAGSCAIHMVGGIAALIGAIFLGPRIGKYHTDEKTGKKTPKAIPGHSLTLGALGVFILWFAWYGFNGAAATDVPTLASILVTTTVAPAVATCTTMIFTWIKDGKPDVSMSLNGSLAGLVAVTASCDVTDALGSGIIGAVAGILVVLVVELLDKKLHIDDPVGAVAVHMANGIWGRPVCHGQSTGLCSVRPDPYGSVLRRRTAPAGYPVHRFCGCGRLGGSDPDHHFLYSEQDRGSAGQRGRRDQGAGRHRAQPALCLCGLYARRRLCCRAGNGKRLAGCTGRKGCSGRDLYHQTGR